VLELKEKPEVPHPMDTVMRVFERLEEA